MKNQYFGDIRDLFKYDLITEIMRGVKSPQKFTFIPMLTPNDNRNDGNKRNFTEKNAGYNNEKLRKFLKRWGHDVPKEKRDFRKIKECFREMGIETCLYNDSFYFSNKGRTDYFHNIEFRTKKKDCCKTHYKNI